MAYQSHGRAGDSYRPSYQRDDGPPPPPRGMFQFQGAAGRDRNNRDASRSDFTFRARTKIADRPLLRTRRGSKEEQVFNGVNGVNGQGEKFRNLEEMTDSDEADMEDSEDERDEGPSTKRAKINDAEDEKPKWSNPDVYTSLPAPCETTGKKVDFVKLIRKARNANTKSTDLAMNDEDFISFDIDDDGAGNTNSAPPDAPVGPRAQDTDRALGKRKRGDDTGARLVARRGLRFYEDGMALVEWRQRDGIHPTPWLRLHPGEAAGLALHMEVLDFYEWVRPRDYETEVRAGVISRIAALLNRLEPGELKAFGSYAAGLYLPTGDMDLVYLTRTPNQRKGFKMGLSSNQFRKFGDFIKKSNIAQPGSITLIGKAKVPIIKFIERVSGLKVDLSFNNETGVVAIETFQKWRNQHPAMPILVAVIKQFLMIRGLNDVAVGGLGGFSIICLVTSLLQHMPLSGTPPNLGHLLIEFFNLYGNLFDRYTVGIRLEPPGYIDKETYGPLLRTNEKAGRLMIIDPNRADNNISGGTSAVGTIFTCFSGAYDVLQNRLADYQEHDVSSGSGFSFLQDLIGGDFSAYQEQRDILHRLHHNQTGPAPAVVPPPPPPVTREPLPPPPPPPVSSKSASQNSNNAQPVRGQTTHSKSAVGNSASTKASTKKSTKAERRATRLKTLRPDIAAFVGTAISLQDAVKYGKYRDYNEMDKDLTQRELERERELNGS